MRGVESRITRLKKDLRNSRWNPMSSNFLYKFLDNWMNDRKHFCRWVHPHKHRIHWKTQHRWHRLQRNVGNMWNKKWVQYQMSISSILCSSIDFCCFLLLMLLMFLCLLVYFFSVVVVVVVAAAARVRYSIPLNTLLEYQLLFFLFLFLGSGPKGVEAL